MAVKAKGVKRVCILNRSTKSPERKREQKKRWFRNGQKWRTGCEGRTRLLPRIADKITDLPLIATGGIADGRGVAAALTLGACAVQIGTGLAGKPQALVVSYWKVIMSVRLSVVAFDFKGSLAKFALPEFNTL